MAVLRRLGAASGRKMNFDDLCVCVCVCQGLVVVQWKQWWKIRSESVDFQGAGTVLRSALMWFSLELGWNWSVKLCYSFILSVWEMERALNLKPSLPWGIDAFWNLIYAVCFLQLKKTTKQNRTTTTKPPFCAWFSYKTKIKNPKPPFLPPQLCAASSKRVPPKHIVLFRFVLCYSWLSTSLGLVDYVFVLLKCQSAFIIFHGSLICGVGWMCVWRLWTVCIGHCWDRSCLNRAVVSMNEAYGRWKSTSSPMPRPSHPASSVIEADISALLQRECLLCWRLREKVNSF